MFSALLIAAAVIAEPAPAIYGIAVAGDGDSLRIGATRVRLFGIDAPEFDQQCSRGGARWACGQAATSHLSTLVTGREVRCLPMGTDPYERVLAKCSVAGVDVNRAMVASGYAVAFRRFSMLYGDAEESAKAARRGLWSGTFEMPAEVRAQAVVKPEVPSGLAETIIRQRERIKQKTIDIRACNTASLPPNINPQTRRTLR